MSGLLALWHLDGRPAHPALLHDLTDLLSHRGPDKQGHWHDGPVGLGHRLLYTTPESRHERQPVSADDGTVHLIWDGRLDNRSELEAALAENGMRLQTRTDPEIVLSAYACWKEEAPAHLLGDFAFVIWDADAGRMFCARDAMGIKPLYYAYNDRLFICSSEIRPLLRHPDVRPDLNEGMIGEYLANEITSLSETLYRDVQRLPPAHALTVHRRTVTKQRYWSIDSGRTIRYRHDDDYAEHFLDLFKEAVGCRLRSAGPVGFYLSGGLDSSSVVATAHGLSGESAITNEMETFSLVFPDLACDESSYIQDLVRMWRIRANLVHAPYETSESLTDCAAADADFPGYPNGAMADPIRALARDKGIRVLLTGTGGDEWLTGSPYHLADLLRTWKLPSLIRMVTQSAGFGEGLRSLVRYGLWPLLPSGARKIFRQLLGRTGIPPWISPRFARRIGLPDRLAVEPDRRQFYGMAHADIAATLENGWWIHALEMEERGAARFGLEERHPFADRRIAEFAVALPEDQRCRMNEYKFVLRQAMRGLLPETIRTRLSKAEFSHAFVRTLSSLHDRKFFEALETAKWIEIQKIQAMYGQMLARYRAGETAHYLWPLWMTAGIELWLRNGVSASHVTSRGHPDRLAIAQPA